jgi:hypothetical protein
MKRTLVFCTLLSLLPAGLSIQPAWAATFSVRVFNGVKGTITSLKIRDASDKPVPVKGFTGLPSDTSEKLNITLPDNECEAFVDVRFEDGRMAIVPANSKRTLNYVPWSQYRAMGGHPE